MNYLKISFIILIIIKSFISYSQDLSGYVLFEKQIKQINTLTDSLKKIPLDSNRTQIANQIQQELIGIFNKAGSYSFTFDSLKRIGKIVSPNKAFRIVTWNVPLTDGSNQYFGFIQMKPKKDTICKLLILNDISQKNIPGISEQKLLNNNWLGALYYNIIPVKIDGETCYTLLGMHFNGLYTNKKIIDILQINDDGSIIFGMPAFLYNSKIQDRIIFEYSINATMILKYEEKLKMIVFDHLAPPSPLYSGNFKFYGPDFSYDGLRFEKGKWIHVTNVDLRK